MVTFFQNHVKFRKIEMKICFLMSSFWLLMWGVFWAEVQESKAAAAIIF